MTVPAPSPRSSSTFLGLQTAVTSAPNARAIWTAKVPTPPEPPLTRTRCPLWTRPWSRSACSAVLPATANVAASSNETPAGFGTTPPFAATITYSAKAPLAAPNTSSPGLSAVTLVPTASTVPAKSVPTTTGLCGRRRCPAGERVKRSTGLAEEAWTRTSRPSSGTAGRSRSASSSSPGDAGRRQTTALTSPQAERRVLVGDQREGVAIDPVAPPQHADHVVEQAPRIRAGEEDREPGGDDHEDGADPEKDEDDVVRNGEDPLDERQPPAHLPGVRVLEVEVDRLLLVSGRITIVEQGEVRGNAVGEAQEVQVPVEPPARVFLPKYEHQHERNEHCRAADHDRVPGRVVAVAEGLARQHREHDHDRDRGDETEGSAEPVEWPGRKFDIELHRIAAD